MNEAVRRQQFLLYRGAIVLERAFVLTLCHAIIAADARLEVCLLQEEVFEFHVAHRCHPVFYHFHELMAGALSLGAPYYCYYFHGSAFRW